MFTIANFQTKSISGECPRCLTETMVIRNRMKAYPYWRGKCLICGLEALLTQCQFCSKVIVDYGFSEVCYDCGVHFGMRGFEPNRTRESMERINEWIKNQKDWHKTNFNGKIKRLINNILEFIIIKCRILFKKEI